VLLAALVVVFGSLEGHSPYVPSVVFIHDCPAYAADQFAAGRLGIVSPDWGASYLVVAYRYLAAKPLTLQEQKSFWEKFHAKYPPREYDWKKELAARPLAKWVKARARYRKDKPPTGVRGDDWWEWSNGENCQEGAFESATQTLRARALQFGAASRELQEWIEGQDQVFLNCPSASAPALPPPLPPSAPALLKADRAYQIAAAHFYSRKYQDALKEFEAIARDSSSPWNPWAPYLEGRVLLRSAFPADFAGFYGGERFDSQKMADAERRFALVEKESTNPLVRRSARGLMSFIAFRLRPEEQSRVVAERLSQRQTGDTFGQDAMDFSTVLLESLGPSPDFPGIQPWTKEYEAALREWRNKRFGELESTPAADEITDWVRTMNYFAPDAQRAHALERWRANPSLLWLLAAISWARGQDEVAPELLASAAEVPPSSPAYLTLLFHRARLLNERGDPAEVRKILDPALPKSPQWPTPIINILKSQRFLAAAKITEFTRYAWRRPVGFSNGAIVAGEAEYCDRSWLDVKCDRNVFMDASGRKFLPQLDFDPAAALNERMPLALLVQFTVSPELPQNLRNRIAPAIWARAAMLDRPKAAASVADAASSGRPELKPFIDAYQRASSAAEHRFRAAYAIAHFPGLRPLVEGDAPRVTRFDYADNFRDNWWCESGVLAGSRCVPNLDARLAAVPYPAFLSPEERRAAHEEASAIAATGKSGNWLSDILIAWAKAHPKDPDAPEALHFAWRAMKFACAADTKRTREVYILLHKRYPDSVWTKKTGIWY